MAAQVTDTFRFQPDVRRTPQIQDDTIGQFQRLQDPNGQFGCVRTTGHESRCDYINAIAATAPKNMPITILPSIDTLISAKEKNDAIQVTTNAIMEDRDFKRQYPQNMAHELANHVAKRNLEQDEPGALSYRPKIIINEGRMSSDSGAREVQRDIYMKDIPTTVFSRMAGEHEAFHLYKRGPDTDARYAEMRSDGCMAAVEIRDSLSRGDYKDTLKHLNSFAKGRRVLATKNSDYDTADLIERITKLPPERLRNLSNEDIVKLVSGIIPEYLAASDKHK